MPGLILPRRRFLAGLAGILAAPAIVRASSLMPVKAEGEPRLLYTLTFANVPQPPANSFFLRQREDGMLVVIASHHDPDLGKKWAGVTFNGQKMQQWSPKNGDVMRLA